jgi:hypothetical protein
MTLIVTNDFQTVSLTQRKEKAIEYYPLTKKELTNLEKTDAENHLHGPKGGIAGRFKSCYYTIRIKT